MPLYDCMLLLKPHVSSEAIMDLVSRIGKHVYRRNGVLTEVKSSVSSPSGTHSSGTVQLGYGIKKLDGRYYQGHMIQMTMMTPPSFHTELYYLNKEDRLLRWLFIKHRDIKFADNFLDDDATSELRSFRGNIFDDDRIDEDDDDDDDGEEREDEPSESKDDVGP